MKALAERLVVPMAAGLQGVAGGGCVWAASAVLPTCATLNCRQHSLQCFDASVTQESLRSRPCSSNRPDLVAG